MTDNKVDLDQLDDNNKSAEDVSDFDLDSFFGELDNATLPKSGDSASGGDEVAKLKKQLGALKKRYEDSSTEAKRLHEENTKFEKLQPLIDMIEENPNLVDELLGSKFSEGSSKNFASSLQKDPDFVFDFDEAVNAPDSKSAKYLAEYLGAVVEDRMSKTIEKEQTLDRMKKERQLIKDSYGLGDDEIDALLDWSKDRGLTLDDVLVLYAKDNNINVDPRRLNALRSSSASMPSVVPEVGNDDKVFNAIKAATASKNIFGD